LGNTLTGFSWAASTLTGGTDGTNTGSNFATSADTTTIATNLKDAINRSAAASSVTATSSGAVVTVTANSGGVAGNTIALADGMGTFSWAGGTLASGADGQPSIVALNKLYSGPSVAASATGSFTATFLSTDFTGGETVTIFKSPTTLTLTANPPTSKTQVGTFNTAAGTGNVVVGGVTITNGGTAATIKGTVSSTPSGTITLTVGSN